MEVLLLKTAKRREGRFQMTNQNEQKVNNQPGKERSFKHGCENITLPGLRLSQNCQRRLKRTPSVADLQVVDGIMSCDLCDRWFGRTNKLTDLTASN